MPHGIGGFGIVAGVLAGAIFIGDIEETLWMLLHLIAALPAFAGGFLEDLTRNVSPASPAPVGGPVVELSTRCLRGNLLSNMRISDLSFRQIAGAGAVVCAGLLAYAYYLQYFDGQDPCPLCLLQRWFYYGILIVLAVGALHAPRRAGQIGYAIGALMFAAGGLAVATRHVWLQHLPPDQVPACGPDLYFMMENFPLARTLQLLLRGSGQCAEVTWTMLGLSIAEWSFVWFAIFALFAVWLMVRKDRRQGRMFG